jgi:Secretion system C-terminal sorting domain
MPRVKIRFDDPVREAKASPLFIIAIAFNVFLRNGIFPLLRRDSTIYFCSRKSVFMKTYSVILILFCIVFIPALGFAQLPVNAVSTASTLSVGGGTASQVVTSHAASVNGITPSTNYQVNYNNNGNVNVTGFTGSGKGYVKYAGFDTIIIRRAANAWELTGGNKQHIFCEGPATVDNSTHRMNFPVAFPQVSGQNYMQRVIKDGFVNRGSDNVFNNDAGSDATANNIERMDFVYKPGMATTQLTLAGFVITERGGNDAFKIAAITGIDVNGNPTSFGPVLTVGTASYGATIVNTATYVMRKDPADLSLRPFSLVPPQAIKAVFVRFSDLGIAASQRVYGYALMGNDVTATTSAQVLNFTNTTYFPRTTTATNGGMDVASAPGIFHADMVLPVQFIDLTSSNKNGEQLLQWSDNDYMDAKEYQLEKSLDGVHFEMIATISAQSAKSSYTDKSFKASSYYRIKASMRDGSYYYSSVLFAKYTGSSSNVVLYPNPAQDKINVSFDGNLKVSQVIIVSADGRECGRWMNNNNTQTLQLDISKLQRGQYFIKLMGSDIVQKMYPVVKL